MIWIHGDTRLDTQNASPQSHPIKNIFLGRHGLRAGWSILTFIGLFLIGIITLSAILGLLAKHLPHSTPHEMSPLFASINEALLLGSWFIAAWVMSRIEEKPLLSYNYSGAHRLPRFLYGLLWGFLCASALVLSLWRLGFLTFEAAPVFNLSALKFAFIWGLLFFTVGFAEESISRGYLQATFTRGIGFWWGAIILSVGFGTLHMGNPGETPIGLFSAGIIALVFCLSLWYTGSLWWAIGFHAAWDWAESYFYGTADSGLVTHGRLLTAHPAGNIYWSGGTTGPEGSLLVLILQIIIVIAMILWWGRRTPSPFAGSAFKPPADPTPPAPPQPTSTVVQW
jgi:uncharacterized protein